jgi:hypothetical protein
MRNILNTVSAAALLTVISSSLAFAQTQYQAPAYHPGDGVAPAPTYSTAPAALPAYGYGVAPTGARAFGQPSPTAGITGAGQASASSHPGG